MLGQDCTVTVVDHDGSRERSVGIRHDGQLWDGGENLDVDAGVVHLGKAVGEIRRLRASAKIAGDLSRFRIDADLFKKIKVIGWIYVSVRIDNHHFSPRSADKQ